jgi:hypothetical protein
MLPRLEWVTMSDRDVSVRENGIRKHSRAVSAMAGHSNCVCQDESSGRQLTTGCAFQGEVMWAGLLELR